MQTLPANDITPEVAALLRRGRALAELRRSNAAGLHVKPRRDRANARRQAIEASRDAG